MRSHSIARSIVFAVINLISVHTAFSAGTVGNEGFTVPNLSCFELEKKFEIPVIGSDLSAITYDPETGKFFAVNNGAATIHELSCDWSLAIPCTQDRYWNMTIPSIGIEDPEGISSMGSRKFAITDENPSLVRTMTLNIDGTVSNVEIVSRVLDTPAGANKGYEGVAWINSKFYVAQESGPVAVREVTTTAINNIDIALDASKGWYSIGDIVRAGDATDVAYVLVKGPVEKIGIHRFDLATGAVTESYAGFICDMGYAEGATFFKGADSIVRMLVVGEPYQALLFKEKDGCSATPGVSLTTGTSLACPIPVATAPLCSSTYADGTYTGGGSLCNYTRCDTLLPGSNDKVCTLTSDPLTSTSCSEEACFNKCQNSEFTTLLGATCTDFAWDFNEAECYLFTSCLSQAWDIEYVQYTMVNEQCEKVYDAVASPTGCTDRTCGSGNTNATLTGTFTVAECRAACKAYTIFGCSAYTHTVSSDTCILYDTCSDETSSTGVNLYVMVDPTCELDSDRGGCANRSCDLDLTPNYKVCDITDQTTCSLETCAYKCANYDGWGAITSTANWCTYYAYDEADKECVLFRGCLNEKYDDDSVLYKQEYSHRKALNDQASGCSKTVDQGGCKDLRCDKALNVNDKVCDTDDVGLSTAACTQDECMYKCGNTTDYKCTHWAFEAVTTEPFLSSNRGECYTFASCENILADTYTTYKYGSGCESTFLEGGCDATRCAKDNDGTASCTKTKGEGGCPLSRCDKNTNTNIKICDTDDVACTIGECEAFCQNTTAFECGFWAFEAVSEEPFFSSKKGECYVFETCKTSGDDTYTTYQMTKNSELNWIKVCDADDGINIGTPGTGACTEEQCMDFCADAADHDEIQFDKCSHWSYERPDAECYLFSSCAVLGEDTYNTYLFDDDTCNKNYAQGGCPRVRCAKSDNLWVKPCDAGDGTACTEPACEKLCATTKVSGKDCTHWAWEKAENECYLFNGCKGASEDSYNTFLYDQACHATLDDGGCPDVRCAKINAPNQEWLKPCDKDNSLAVNTSNASGDYGLCTVKDCEALCTSEQPGCTHFAWEKDNLLLGECYIFSGCYDMSEDTYVTYHYVAPTPKQVAAVSASVSLAGITLNEWGTVEEMYFIEGMASFLSVAENQIIVSSVTAIGSASAKTGRNLLAVALGVKVNFKVILTSGGSALTTVANKITSVTTSSTAAASFLSSLQEAGLITVTQVEVDAASLVKVDSTVTSSASRMSFLLASIVTIFLASFMTL